MHHLMLQSCRQQKNLVNTDFVQNLKSNPRSSIYIFFHICIFFPYLLGLVGVGQWDHHPDDVEIIEGSTRGEGAGQDGCLAAGNLNAALRHGHVQRLHAHYGKKKQSAARSSRRSWSQCFTLKTQWWCWINICWISQCQTCFWYL